MTTSCSSSRPSSTSTTTTAPCLAPKQVDEILAAFFVLVHVDPDHLPSLAAGTPLPPLGDCLPTNAAAITSSSSSSAQHSGTQQQQQHKKGQYQQPQAGLSTRMYVQDLLWVETEEG